MLSQRLAQTQLRRVLDQRESLALTAEELSLKPGYAMLEGLDPGGLRPRHFTPLRRGEIGHLSVAGHVF
jgi:hypothetical protein